MKVLRTLSSYLQLYAGNIILIHFYVIQEYNLLASMRLLFR